MKSSGFRRVLPPTLAETTLKTVEAIIPAIQ
jgi:hypothetical protein